MTTIFLVILAGILYTLFDILVARASGKVNDYYANVIFNGLGALIPLIILLVIKAKHQPIQAERHGIILNICAGFAIAAFSILFVNIFAQGGNLSFVIPAIYGIVLVLSSIIGWVLFKEHFSLMGLVGVVQITVGVTVIAVSKLKT